MPNTIIAAGGDMRFPAAARKLAEKNRVYAAGFDGSVFFAKGVTLCKSIGELPPFADVLVLPMPVSDDNVNVRAPFYSGTLPLESLADRVRSGGTVFGGRVSDKVRTLFANKGLTITDYLLREELAVLNAEATAEGAVQIALEEQTRTLLGEKVLILGMGRIAKALIKILSGFGADITAAARKYSDIAWAQVMGCSGVYCPQLENSKALSEAELIINTVPALLLDKDTLSRCNRDVLIIDLASKPGGIDFDAAAQSGLRVIWALSLPGKTAPVSAGEMIGETIENILSESCAKH